MLHVHVLELGTLFLGGTLFIYFILNLESKFKDGRFLTRENGQKIIIVHNEELGLGTNLGSLFFWVLWLISLHDLVS